MSLAVSALRLARASRGGWNLDLLRRDDLLNLVPPFTLALVTVVVFWSDLTAGITYYGADTLSFYYPLTSWYAEQLRAGRLPLWFPYIFGGYPLFADGEVGMVYPLHLLAYSLLPSDTAFVLLRPLHFWLAAVFTCWLGRLLGLSRPGATLAGLVFAYGSFMVGHLQHENIIRSSIWLPLELALLELAYRVGGTRRALWLLACGLVLGVQMLGIHVQPVLISLLGMGAYALFAPLGRYDWRSGTNLRRELAWPGLRSILARCYSRALGLSLVLVTGASLAAVQLVPLYQLGQRSLRATGVSYDFSTSYSVPPVQLVQLVLPYLFRPDPFSYWGLWSPVETTVYLGVAPLLLALAALAYLHTRTVVFLGLLSGVGLLLALGDYLPVKLYSLVWSLPGFSFLRVPARFVLLFTLAGGLLAGFGFDWLNQARFDWLRPRRVRLRVRRLIWLAASFAGGAVALGLLFVGLRWWLEADPGATRRAIETHYLSLRRGEWGLSASAVYVGMLRALDLANPRTQGGLLLMLASPLVVLLRGRHLLPRRAWLVAVFGVAIVDLVVFAQGFNPQRHVSALKLDQPPIQFLSQNNGLHRVFVEPQLYGKFGPNQLVSASIDFAGGYSSLEPRRAAEYWWSIVRQDNVLLDLFNVRYVVAPLHVPYQTAFEGMLFHPADRLMRGSIDNPSGTEDFAFEPWGTQALVVVASSDEFSEVPFGTPVAELTLSGPQGERRVTLRTGDHIGDSAAATAATTEGEEGAGPRVAWKGPSIEKPGQTSILYGSVLELDQPIMATRLSIQRIGPPGALNIHGLGLLDRPGLPVRSLTPANRAKYRQVYQDQDLQILENTAALPRAFLAGSARGLPGQGSPVDQLLLGPFDPRQTILVDSLPEGSVEPITHDGPVGSAEIVDYSGEQVTVRVSASRPGYLVLTDRFDDDWRVWVGGHQASLLRADGMFRAVQVGSGEQTVVFRYEPLALRMGLAISLISAALVVALISALLLLQFRPWSGRRTV